MFDDALQVVRNYLARPEHLVVGLMTGTSADAVDAVLVRFRGNGLETRHEVLAYRESALDPALRREILDIASSARVELERLMRLDAALGECYAAAVMELLGRSECAPEDVDAIGSHGQTVRHVPRHAARDRDAGVASEAGDALTLQVGSAAVLAERTGIAVVSNFRARDTAAGGEGAPLVPLADYWLFRSPEESRALLNLGGMANVTHIPRDAPLERVLAFDTGPGNAVLDSLVTEMSGGRDQRDEGGALALAGKPVASLLTPRLEDPFFAQAPPRSTGRESFGDAYARALISEGRAAGATDSDLLATAAELTAASASDAIRRFLVPRGGVDVVVASGGGVRNAALMAALERRLAPIRLETSERLGVDPSGKEALAFAFLAHQTLCGAPGNVPSATGADRAVVLGQITPGLAP
jgi:anhydro-N-acetylmuramic acid kinase